MQFIRQAIRNEVHKLVGIERGAAPPAMAARGDYGLFGPQSVCWRVHRDFTTMMVGGVAALLLQMLHPAALAGVWDHSNFRQDRTGRLRRTAQFISGTTYGSTDRAMSLIERVRVIHERVSGVLPDGTAYRASDPDLLRFVHVTEVRCFLLSYLRYRNPILPAADGDRYFAEMTRVAEMLGAVDVPKSRRETERYLEDMRPHLRVDDRTRDVAATIMERPGARLATAPMQAVLLDAATDLLPDWAAAMHGLDLPARRRPFVRAGTMGAASLVRWGLAG